MSKKNSWWNIANALCIFLGLTVIALLKIFTIAFALTFMGTWNFWYLVLTVVFVFAGTWTIYLLFGMAKDLWGRL